MLTHIVFHISGRQASAGVPGTALALTMTRGKRKATVMARLKCSGE